MRVVVASGKGGTGKTTVAVNLAVVLARKGYAVRLLDADVEEPNAHLFIAGEFKGEGYKVNYYVPRVNPDLCDGCGKCREFCNFGAITILKNLPLIFDELCHGCGGCALVCPRRAIREEPVVLGYIEGYESMGIQFFRGRLEVGKATAAPIVRELLSKFGSHRWDEVEVVDAPPGTGCPVIVTMEKADLVLLVTEPTPFGLHDLELAAKVATQLGKKAGVIINRADLGGVDIEAWARENRMEVVAKIPFRRQIAEAYSKGLLVVDHSKECKAAFEQIVSYVLAQGFDK